MVSTIVSSNLAGAIAKEYGIKIIETLTGFKYIGEQIKFFEQKKDHEFLFGYEESYGCLVGTHARDKDAVVAVMKLCEAAAYYKTQGKTLWDAMVDLYEKYGYYKDDIQSITLKGIEGLEKIQNIMELLRKEPPAQIGDYTVTAAKDYKMGINGLPKSNVLYYELTDDAWVCVRPSGTEPKVKFYYGIKGSSLKDAEEKSSKLGQAVLAMVDEMMEKI